MAGHRVIVTLFLLSALARGQVNFSTANWQGQFAAGSGVLQSLQTGDFDFAPSDVFNQRNGPNNYHTGGLNLRYRAVGTQDWTDVRTAANRNTSLPSSGAPDGSLLTSDLSPALLGVSQYFNVSRTWYDYDGDLALHFAISNIASDQVELGAVGFPIEFNNIFTGRMAVDTANLCVLVDPYIGLDAGYVQATRLTGTGPNLVVTPLNSTKLEGWNFLTENRSGPLYYQSQTYEGNYEWLSYSQAYADQEWNATEPWNPPTSLTLAPGESVDIGLRFSPTSSLPEIEDTVAANGNPVAVGIPGYVLPSDVVGSLYFNHTSPVVSISVDPADALAFTLMSVSLPAPWTGYNVKPSSSAFGRVRATISYNDGRNQTVHYHVAHSAPDALNSLGTFATREQFFNDTSDPFHRAPSVISFDSSTGTYVLQDNRAWIVGLSDEGGAGSFVAASMKQTADPNAGEVALLEQFVNQVLWGYLQLSSGAQEYGVRKSLFFYEPSAVPGYTYDPSVNFGGTWDRDAAYLINRAYDYVWVSELYWALYTSAVIQPGILTFQSPYWYLNQSYETVMYALDASNRVGYANLGLMGETVWGQLLQDLYTEGFTDKAAPLEAALRARQQVWAGQPDPYGSEMAWDSTGQEGVYYWSAYFNDSVTAEKTLASIPGYMPTIAHWGYNGNARRYWDFQYAGSAPLARVERQIHHYGSGLNSQPLLAAYRTRSDPGSSDALYDLRVGYGGHTGPLSNIQEDGMGSMAFHSYADTLHWDSYTGDYGPGFLGHVLGSASYIAQHPIFGMVAFAGNLQDQGNGTVVVQPRDSVRRRVYVAPLGLWVTFDAGEVQEITYDAVGKAVNVSVAARKSEKTDVIMKFEQTAAVEGAGTIGLTTPGLTTSRGGYVVPIPDGGTASVAFGST